MSTRKKVAAVMGATLISIASLNAFPSFAEPRDGGDWQHGASGGRVWSNYWHTRFVHGSSVQGRDYVDSGCVAPNVWSRANARSRTFGSDGAWYRFC